MAFSFQEGLLTQALARGDWLLLDEINLAAPEVLQRLTPLLEEGCASLLLSERGDVAPIARHPAFRVGLSGKGEVGKVGRVEGSVSV